MIYNIKSNTKGKVSFEKKENFDKTLKRLIDALEQEAAQGIYSEITISIENIDYYKNIKE